MNRNEDVEFSLALSTEMIKMMERQKVSPGVAYAAFGQSFLRMHQGLKKTKADWLEIVGEMAEMTEWSK
jgi:hypothetical protein